MGEWPPGGHEGELLGSRPPAHQVVPDPPVAESNKGVHQKKCDSGGACELLKVIQDHYIHI